MSSASKEKLRNFKTKTPSVLNIDGTRNSFSRSFLFESRHDSGVQAPSAETFQFIVPPEAPVFQPTAEEFSDPLAYINKIRSVAENTGICKIKPPSNWQPPFTVDVDKLRFTPRIQRLNELEAKTRIKLNFLDQIAKFWELQGSSLKIPMVDRRALDLYSLHRLVQREGGADLVTRDRKWARIAINMNYQVGRGIGSLLKQHYERLLYPYDVFIEGKKKAIKMECETELDLKMTKDFKSSSLKIDKDYKPPTIKTEKDCKPQIIGRTRRPAEKVTRRAKKPRLAQNKKSESSTIPKTEKDAEELDEAEKHKELKRLQFYGAGPKMAGYNSGKKMSSKHVHEYDPLEKYVCHNCGRGDDEESMLLCDGCDDSYHTFCLVPPLVDVPKGDWRCPKCLAVEVSKPTEAFGFEQAQREYSLQQFGEMADQFKSEYFNMPVHLVPTSTVEKEFWRVVSSIEEDVTVEYGADLHSMDHGSGFPTHTSLNLQPADLEYVRSNWNLNNLPVLDDSVLGHIHADISGMKIPWMYVGMCFATFCWHNEDHWSYSINYLHWGEPKTWYGVPGNKAVKFEETMKTVAPELFQTQPDLLHQLVTIMNPNILMNADIPVFRTDQHAGEFVVTFPRAYHAGFNQGYNFAEAVNFAPADWIQIGRECILHYGHLRRFCVFSHDELVCKMALEPQKLSPLIAAATFKDMVNMVDVEKKLRKTILDWGVTTAEREAFELLPDDERQCEICKTTCFLSAVTCSCNNDALVCLRHYDELCKCPPNKHTLRYRYTLDELPRMMQKLKAKAEAYETWLSNVKSALNPDRENLLTLSQMKNLLAESVKNMFPKCDLTPVLVSAIDDAEKCANVIRQLETTIRRTRTRNSNERKYDLSFDELQLFIEEIDNLSCVIDEINIVKNLLAESYQFETTAKLLLTASLNTVNAADVQDCIQHGDAICIELPSLGALHVRLAQTKWLSEVLTIRRRSEVISLDAVYEFLQRGEALSSDVFIENQLSELRRLVNENLDWELRARTLLMAAKSTKSVTDIDTLLAEAEDVETFLPNENSLRTISNSVKEWKNNLANLNSEDYYPYLDVIQALYQKGLSLEVHIAELAEIEQYINSGTAWLEKTLKIFLRKNSVLNLMEALCPRTPQTLMAALKCRKVSTEEDPNVFTIPNDMDPFTLVNNFKLAEKRELEGLRLLRVANMAKAFEKEEGCKFCICQRGASGIMMQCELCKDWFHSTCVNLPKIASFKVRKNFTAVALRLGFKDCKFICSVCQRTKRPRLEIILGLLVALQRLSVRIPEGEALQCLTERAMTWQDHVKSLLKSEELEQASTKLNLLSLRANLLARPKSEELNNPEVTSCTSNDAQCSQSADVIASEDSNSSQGINSPVVSSSTVGDGTLDEHAYSLHFPTFNDADSVLHLSDETRLQLEDTLLEGDLLEIALDESHQLWRILQAARNPERDIILKDFNQVPKLNVPVKKQRKRRLEEADTAKSTKATKNDTDKKLPKRKPSTTTRKQSSRRKGRTKRAQTNSDDENDTCASENCVQPSEEEVDWVQCDGGCDQWFHMACVGLSAQEISEDEDYICLTCSQTNSAFESLQPPSPENQSLNPESPVSMQPSSTRKDIS